MDVTKTPLPLTIIILTLTYPLTSLSDMGVWMPLWKKYTLQPKQRKSAPS